MSDIENTFWQSYDKDLVQVFGINVNESVQNTINFTNSLGVTFPILMDPGGHYYFQLAVWGISPYPQDVIIDQMGIIRYQSAEYDPHHMQKIINQLLKNNDTKTSITEKFNVNVYPNPFNQQTRIELTPSSVGNYRLGIYDITGRIILEESLISQTNDERIIYNLNLDSYATGLYILSVSNQIHTENRKLILLR